MKKHTSFLTLFVVGTLLLGLVGVITALAAPAAATADGSVTLDKDWYTTTGTIKITVVDADLDVAVASSTTINFFFQTAPGTAVVTITLPTDSAVVGTPKVLNTATACPANTLSGDISTALIDPTLSASIFNNGEGISSATLFIVSSVVKNLSSDVRNICFDDGGIDTATVKLAGLADATTLVATPLSLKETGAETGKFEITVTLGTASVATGTNITLKTLNGDKLTATYTDAVNAAGATSVKREDKAQVETNPTLIANVKPVNKFATQLQTPVLTATLNDSDSGIDIGNVFVILDVNGNEFITYDGAPRRIVDLLRTDVTQLRPQFVDTTDSPALVGQGLVVTPQTPLLPDISIDTSARLVTAALLQVEVDDENNVEVVKAAITGTSAPGTDVNISFTAPQLGVEGDENEIAWFIVVFDVAGNPTLSDSDPASINDLGDDGLKAGTGDDADGPQLLDVDEPHVLRVDRKSPSFGDNDVLTGKYWDAETSSVKSDRKTSIQVIFSENLDSNTVSAADFTVDGLTPLDAQVFAKEEKSVFLTLATDMAPDAKPKVALVSAVSDKAGNTKAAISAIDALDKIAPKFTVTLTAPSADSKGNPLTNKGITIAITSDEAVSGNLPTVNLYSNTPDPSTIERAMPVVVTGSNSWKAEVTTALGVSQGKTAVVVTGNDLGANAGTKGETDHTVSGSIVFTYDTVIAAPTFDPVKSGTATLTEVFSTDPFIRAIYSEEVTITKAEFGVKDGTLANVTTAMFSSDNKTWIYPASGLVVDTDYEIKVDAQDLAGNTKKGDDTNFTVKERKKIEYPLLPGNNLISLVGDPADPSINNVGLPSAVTSVITYHPHNPESPWAVATRDAAGNLTGTLTAMDARHAYWVESTSTAPIEVETPQQGFAAVPPSIPVVAGWNLVPVVVLNVDELDADDDGNIDAIGADRYFGSTKWITAYSFDTATRMWTKIQPKQVPSNDVFPKKGYWLYVASDGILVP